MLKIQSAPGSWKPPEKNQGGITEETVLQFQKFSCLC